MNFFNSGNIGACCGTRILYHLQSQAVVARTGQAAAPRRAQTFVNKAKRHGAQVSCILIDAQLTPEVCRQLDEYGFRQVDRWYNGNSRNYCNMFVYSRNTQASQRKSPFDRYKEANTNVVTPPSV